MGLPDSCLTISYRLSYALFRVAGTLPEGSSRRHLEDKALDLIIAGLEEHLPLLEKHLRTIEYLVRFLGDTNGLHPHTASLLRAEIAALNSAIAGLPDSAEPIPAKELFPPTHSPSTEESQISSPLSTQETESGNPLNDRQEKILNLIRQSGNLPDSLAGCRLRDLQVALPEVSERTLRYDLGRLLHEGKIERIGSGGPSTAYKLRFAP